MRTIAALLLLACSPENVCGSGRAADVDGSTYCGYSAPLDDGFMCPAELPVRRDVEGGAICASSEIADETLGAICDELVLDCEGADHDGGMPPTDAGPGEGVSCRFRRSWASCNREWTEEPDVSFWLVAYNGEPEHAIATDSEGINAMFNQPVQEPGFPGATPVFWADDDTLTSYNGGDAFDPGDSAVRSGSTFTLVLNEAAPRRVACSPRGAMQ